MLAGAVLLVAAECGAPPPFRVDHVELGPPVLT
jgi:hypothetical protein